MERDIQIGKERFLLLEQETYKPGDWPPPEGYLAKSEWANIQIKAGIRQGQCPSCKKWFWPKENHSTADCMRPTP